MTEKGVAVTVKVRRDDGSTEHVRVGTAYRADGAFRIRFGEMFIADAGLPRGLAVETEGEAIPLKVEPVSWKDPASVASTANDTSALRGLEFCAERARRNLANPAKARWHEDERALLEAIEAELSRQRRTTS